jgi:hypothetical protein
MGGEDLKEGGQRCGGAIVVFVQGRSSSLDALIVRCDVLVEIL